MMRIAVRVTPNASADRIEGRGVDDAGREFLKLRVRAVPEDGKANAAVEKLLAKALGLPKSGVRVASGQTARLKGVEIDADAGSEAARRIAEWMSDDGKGD